MTREIKFRAWLKTNKIMTEIDKIDFINNEVAFGFHEGSINAVELMQFTGLKDKKGKEIYEGDILADNTSYYYTLIGWDVASFKTKSVLKAGLNLNHSMPSYEFKNIIDYDHFERMEVIGNIHKNPELLEDK